MNRLLVIAALITTCAACDPTTPTGAIDPADGDTGEAPVCQVIFDGRTICFPADHHCYDPHGIGDGVPVEVDCWGGNGRACHTGLDVWPECAGGWAQN